MSAPFASFINSCTITRACKPLNASKTDSAGMNIAKQLQEMKTFPVKIKDNDVVITAGAQSKASLIGKNKIRLNEMTNILEQYFDIKKVMIK